MNKVCEELKNVQLEGNIVPISWYSHIKTEKNTIDHIAITLLADIFYWYRPSEVRDELTGETIGYKQKFKADKLQKNYQEYSNLFGYSKTQVKRAIDNLIRLKLITREFRNIHTKTGLAINNVMYLEPILNNIFTLTYRVTSLQSKVTPLIDVDTNTDTSTKTSTNFSENSSPNNINRNTDTNAIDSINELSNKNFLDKPVKEKKNNNINQELINKVLTVWNNQHNLTTHKLSTATRKFQKKHFDAIKDIGLDKVSKSIANYGKIVGDSNIWYYTHRFDLWDFLVRALEKFLDEAKPFENFKNKKQNFEQKVEFFDPYSHPDRERLKDMDV